MSRFTSREEIYNKAPLSLNDNRDEHILIDVLGNWIPECDMIYYGLLNSEYSEELYKLKIKSMFNPHDTYLETCYFSRNDLIRYLASPNDDLANLSKEYLEKAISTAMSRYLYEPCNETMLRHSIIELAYYKFVKSITLIIPWEIRELDYQYIKSIIPDTVLDKFKIVSGDMLGFLESKANSSIRYTTIILNSLTDLNELIDNCDKYHTSASFFLLRNHSENVNYEISDDPENPGKKMINFKEVGTKEILSKLMDLENGIPLTQMRFARYEPMLYIDAKPNESDFILGR